MNMKTAEDKEFQSFEGVSNKDTSHHTVKIT